MSLKLGYKPYNALFYLCQNKSLNRPNSSYCILISVIVLQHFRRNL